MAAFNAARREAVWWNTDIRTSSAFKRLGASAFGLWTRLPFLADDAHQLPSLTVIARDSQIVNATAARRLGELTAVGLVEFVPGNRVNPWRLTPLSQRFYSFSEPADEEEV